MESNLTKEEFDQIVEESGRDAANAALRFFINPDAIAKRDFDSDKTKKAKKAGRSFVDADPGLAFLALSDPQAFSDQTTGQDIRRGQDTFIGLIRDGATSDQIRESAALIKGGTGVQEANSQASAFLKKRVGTDLALQARQRATQQQRVAAAGASNRIATSPQGLGSQRRSGTGAASPTASGLFAPAHLTKRKLTGNPILQGGIS